jgi:hypothetical protein
MGQQWPPNDFVYVGMTFSEKVLADDMIPQTESLDAALEIFTLSIDGFHEIVYPASRTRVNLDRLSSRKDDRKAGR